MNPTPTPTPPGKTTLVKMAEEANIHVVTLKRRLLAAGIKIKGGRPDPEQQAVIQEVLNLNYQPARPPVNSLAPLPPKPRCKSRKEMSIELGMNYKRFLRWIKRLEFRFVSEMLSPREQLEVMTAFRRLGLTLK